MKDVEAGKSDDLQLNIRKGKPSDEYHHIIGQSLDCRTKRILAVKDCPFIYVRQVPEKHLSGLCRLLTAGNKPCQCIVCRQ